MPNRNVGSLAKESETPAAAMRQGADWASAAALGLIGFLAVLYVAAFAILAVRLPFGRVTLTAAVAVIGAALVVWSWRSKLWTRRAGFYGSSLAVVVVWIAVSLWAAGHIYDTSYDGQVYHMLAVTSLHNGWNPMYDPYGVELQWIRHYPKAGWLTEAAIYALTGHVETGKAFNLIAMASAFLAAAGALLRLLAPAGGSKGNLLVRMALSFIIAGLACGNPVTVTQMFTFYNDGVIGSLLLALIGSSAAYALAYERKSLATAAVCVVLLINIKFTAIAYAGLICGSLVIALMIRNRNRSVPAEGGMALTGRLKRLFVSLCAAPVKRAVTILAVSAVIALAGFGWNPYILNTVDHGHPFYPLAGRNPVDIMTLNSPQNFIQQSRFKTFLISYTSKTEDAVTPRTTKPAVWWPIPWKAFENVNVDTRVAGFGPYSPWLLAGTVALGAILLLCNRKAGILCAVVVAALLCTVFVNPEPWWARYVPQLWLVPLAVIAAGWISGKSAVRAAALLLLLVCGIDAAGSAKFILQEEHKQSREVGTQLVRLKESGMLVRLYTAEYLAVPVRLAEFGIPYRIASDEEPPCEKPEHVLYATSMYCLDPIK